MELTIKFRNYKYTVSQISFHNNAWQHFAIVWNLHDGAKIMINGVGVGSFRKTMNDYFISTTDRLKYNLIFGISHEDKDSNEHGK